MLRSSGERLELAGAAYVSGDFVVAKVLVDEILNESATSLHGLGARFLRARGYEDGVFSGRAELDRAYDDFSFLADHADSYGSDGFVGCARVLFELDGRGNKDQILLLCQQAIELDYNVKALMLMGWIHEEILKDGREARRWYLKAFFRGMPWGMRFYARSHGDDGNSIMSMLAHAVATLTSPFLVMVYGVRSPWK